MPRNEIATGTAHKVPPDLRKALLSDRKVLAAWESLTPLARNEWICWVVSVKKSETRNDMFDGQKRSFSKEYVDPVVGWDAFTEKIRQ